MKRIILALLFLPVFAQAGEWGLQVHIASRHFIARDYFQWNEGNPGIGIRYSFDRDWAVQAGRYLNSYSLPGYDAYTNYVAADYTPWHHQAFSLGGYAGVGSGYDEPMFYAPNGQPQVVNGKPVIQRFNERPLIAAAGLIGRWDYGKFNITVRINPAMTAIETGFKF